MAHIRGYGTGVANFRDRSCASKRSASRSASRASVSTRARSPASPCRQHRLTRASSSGPDGRASIPARARERRQLALRDHHRWQRHPHPDRRAPDGRRRGPRHRQPRDRGRRPRDPGGGRQRQALRGAAHAAGPRPAARAPTRSGSHDPGRVGRAAAGSRSCRRASSGSATRSTTTTRRSGSRSSRACRPSGSFVEEFAPARTYGFLKDLGLMRKNGLARGGSLDNAVVLGKRGPLNGLASSATSSSATRSWTSSATWPWSAGRSWATSSPATPGTRSTSSSVRERSSAPGVEDTAPRRPARRRPPRSAIRRRSRLAAR